MNTIEFILRDGIDLYFNEDTELAIFVFLASRKRISIKVESKLLLIISKLDGINTIDYYKDYYQLNKKEIINFDNLVNYLYSKNILIEKNWIDLLEFRDEYKLLLSRQFKYLLDIIDSGVSGVQEIQNKILNTKVAIFGLGAVGSLMARELSMIGFSNFLLVDYDVIDEQDIARNILFDKEKLGSKKISLAKEMLLKINPNIAISTVSSVLDINTNLQFLDECDLIINSANTPYIGYTSIKLSRYCIEKNKLLFVCGGFDAHLASLGELIVPGITPCSDCYTTYFTESLKDWKPAKHPITDRTKVFGGLSSLSLFSASMSVMTILKYFIDNDSASLSKRGEFLFDSYTIDEFNVPKDQHCHYCSS